MALDSTHIATAWTVLTTNSVTIDLTTHAQGPASGVREGQPCRMIVVTKPGVGTLVLKKTNGSKEKMTSLIAGQALPGAAVKIAGPSSSFSEIIVYW